jgi:ribosomal protein L16 Arg81 hydroxylase
MAKWGKELAGLLDPIGPKEFLAKYWAKRTLHVKGERDRFQKLFDKRRFWKALDEIDRQGAESRSLIRAHWGKQGADDGSGRRFTNESAVRAREVLKKGASLCINVISDGDRGLYDFCAAVKRQLGYPGLVRFNAYYSPHEGGLPVHFDARIAWVVQLSGTKKWWFTDEPAVDWPRQNADRNDDGSATYLDGSSGEAWEQARATTNADFRHVVLEPGDCLIMPAGVWHLAEANKESLALTLCFDPVSPLAILYEQLDADLRSSQAWRACDPLQAGGGKLLARRTRELAKQIDRLAKDEKRLEQVWSALINS